VAVKKQSAKPALPARVLAKGSQKPRAQQDKAQETEKKSPEMW
jgi:hypothetical protein